MNTIQVVGLGALNIDQIYQVERILEDGETVVKESGLFPGGSAANTIYGLAKLGVSTGFAGIIGDDAEGKLLLRSFQEVGVDTRQIRVKRRARTGSVICLSDSSGKRSLYVLPAANRLLTMADLDLDYINQAKVFHLSSFADERQFKVTLELMSRLDSSVKVSFAPGALYTAKGLKALAPIIRKTYVLFINESEIRQLTGEDVKAGAESCLRQGCRIIAVTLGRGASWKTAVATSYISDGENEYIVEPGRKNIISAVDTTGAGDAFAAGFLYGLLNDQGLQQCGRFGGIVAEFSITKVGARQGLPTLAELSRRHRKLYHKDL